MVQPAPEESPTAEQFFELPDRDFTELLDGRLAPTTPTGALYGKVEVRLTRLLDEFLEQTGAGWVLSGEVGVITRRNPDRVRGVDVALVFFTPLRLDLRPLWASGRLAHGPSLPGKGALHRSWRKCPCRGLTNTSRGVLW